MSHYGTVVHCMHYVYRAGIGLSRHAEGDTMRNPIAKYSWYSYEQDQANQFERKLLEDNPQFETRWFGSWGDDVGSRITLEVYRKEPPEQP